MGSTLPEPNKTDKVEEPKGYGLMQVHTHSCQIQVLQLLAPDMNVYGPASASILQDLAQGTMCIQGHTCVHPKAMFTQQRLTF